MTGATRTHRPFGGVERSGDRKHGCGVCRFGLVLVVATEVGSHGMTYACICERGRLKREAIQTLTSIESVLTDVEMRELWPDGTPEPDTGDQVLQRMADSGVPPKFLPWSMTSYAERFKRDREQRRYCALASDWIELAPHLRSDVLIFGPNGTGKTGLAIAMLRAVAERRQSVAFWTVRELSIAWRDTYNRDETSDGETEAGLLARVIEPTVLVLDEVTGQRQSDFIESTLTLIADRRQREQRPTIFTLNLPNAGLVLNDSEMLTDVLGPTLQDRLRERGQFWPLRGASQRKTYRAGETR